MGREPNFYLAGVQKGGTSTLHLWLQQHPSVFLASRKELHYFCRCPDPGLRAANSDEEYARHFASADGAAQIVGESSPCYVYYPSAIEEIGQRFPGSRILISLRDPVERFWSHLLMNRIYRPHAEHSVAAIIDRYISGKTRQNALDDLVGASMYSTQIRATHAVIGRDRARVIFLEEMALSPDFVLKALFSFLELPFAEIDMSQRDKVYVEPRNAFGRLTLRNPTVRRMGVALIPPRQRHYLRTRWLGDPHLKPELDHEDRVRLRELFAADSRRLEDLLERELPWSWHRT